MRKVTKLLIILTSLVIFGGCATSGPKFTELAPTISNMSPDTGRIYIYRPSSLGAAIRPDVKLNGEVIGEAISWGFFYVDRKPGTYEILTSTEVDRKLSLILNEGQSRYVRLNIGIGFFVGHVYPELVESEVGEKEIKDCRFTGQKNNLYSKSIYPAEKSAFADYKYEEYYSKLFSSKSWYTDSVSVERAQLNCY